MIEIVETGFLADRIDRVYRQARRVQARRGAADARSLLRQLADFFGRHGLSVITPVGARHA